MLQRGQRANGVEHLLVGVGPVYLGVLEVVKLLVVANLLAVVEQRHTEDGEREHGQRIAVVAIHRGEGAFAQVLVVVCKVDHAGKLAGRVGDKVVAVAPYRGG